MHILQYRSTLSPLQRHVKKIITSRNELGFSVLSSTTYYQIDVEISNNNNKFHLNCSNLPFLGKSGYSETIQLQQ